MKIKAAYLSMPTPQQAVLKYRIEENTRNNILRDSLGVRYVTHLAFLVVILLAGCGQNNSSAPTSTTPVQGFQGLPFSGHIMAGNLPIAGSSVAVYLAGTSGNGLAPTKLFDAPFVTDASGSFNVNSAYVCPESTSLLYLVATGGHTGSAFASDGDIALFSSPGTCADIAGEPVLTINEATTVAGAYAFAQFLTLGAQLGSSSTNTSGILLAAGTLANLVSLNSGQSPSTNFPATGVAPAAQINTLANVLNACITANGKGSACSQLYINAAISGVLPSNTFDAVINIAHHPGSNIAALYALGAGSTVYSPALPAAPSDWTLSVTYGGGGLNEPTAVSIDSQGKVWVADYVSAVSLFSNTGAPAFPNGITGFDLHESYGAAVDENDNVWIANQVTSGSVNHGLGSVTVLNASGQQVVSSEYSSGGIYYPVAVAIDRNNTTWIVNYGASSVTQLSNSGAALSGTSGYSGTQLSYPVAAAVDSKGNGYIANQVGDSITKISPDGSSMMSFACGQGTSGVAIDANDNVWATNFYSNSVSFIGADGTNHFGSGVTGGALANPSGIAVDGSGNVWVTNYRGNSVTELAGAYSSTPGTFLSPAVGWAPNPGLFETFGVAIDAGGNIWMTNYGNNTLTEVVGLATPVKTPLLGSVRVP